MSQTEMYMECLIPEEQLDKSFLPLVYACWFRLPMTCHFASMAGVGNHQGSLTTLHIKTSPW